MFALLCMIGVIFYVGNKYGEHAAAIAILIGLGILVVAYLIAGHNVNKAYGNFINYWANGGPGQYRKRNRR